MEDYCSDCNALLTTHQERDHGLCWDCLVRPRQHVVSLESIKAKLEPVLSEMRKQVWRELMPPVDEWINRIEGVLGDES